jgi:hypothetical protein
MLAPSFEIAGSYLALAACRIQPATAGQEMLDGLRRDLGIMGNIGGNERPLHELVLAHESSEINERPRIRFVA